MSTTPQTSSPSGPSNDARVAEEQLHAASVRATTARVRVLSTLLRAASACSHQDVQDQLPDMDRVTLYRALDCLTEAGLAHKISGDDRVFRYSPGLHATEISPTHSAHSHGHFKCTQCARVFCLDGKNAQWLHDALTDAGGPQASLKKQLQGILRKTLGDGFRCDDIELTIKGCCARCNR